jgi:hypothetical protein
MTNTVWSDIKVVNNILDQTGSLSTSVPGASVQDIYDAVNIGLPQLSQIPEYLLLNAIGQQKTQKQIGDLEDALKNKYGGVVQGDENTVILQDGSIAYLDGTVSNSGDSIYNYGSLN